MRCAPTVVMLALVVSCAGSSSVGDSPEIRVWRQFVSALKEGRLKEDRIKPYEELQQLLLPPDRSATGAV